MTNHPDITITHHGSITLVHPHTELAKTWISDNAEPAAQFMGNSLACEPRYLDHLVQGMREDGLIVEGI